MKSCCCCCFLLIVTIAIISVIVHIHYSFSTSLINKSDIEKCPYCYGKTICEDFVKNKITLKSDVINAALNLINTKNVYFADYNGVDVVIKKLGNDEELNNVDKILCLEIEKREDCNLASIVDYQDYNLKLDELLLQAEKGPLNDFRVCSKDTADLILKKFLNMKPKHVEDDVYLKNLWTILKVNVEPLILQLLKSEDGWLVPKYYGSCGRFVVEAGCGNSILTKKDAGWMDRAYMALQLLQMAKNFTGDHKEFRFYLTDISPDNLAVDDRLKVSFIDLENVVVLKRKNETGELTVHKSQVFPEFAFSTDALCSHSISDHNYYGVCKFLLSQKAPAPMMKNGLLHSPPVAIVSNHKILFDLVEKCASPSKDINRFKTAEMIMDALTYILEEQKDQRKS